MTTQKVTVRPATALDISAINSINQYYVENTVVTLNTQPNTDDEALASLHDIKGMGCPYLVAVDSSGTVVGYTYVSPFRGVKPGYRHTLELSLFVHVEHVKGGIGKQLMTKLIQILENPTQWTGWFDGVRLLECRPRQLVAIMAVDVDGPGSGMKLRDWYVKLGFEEQGRLKDVGWKKERWIDTIYLQKTLGS